MVLAGRSHNFGLAPAKAGPYADRAAYADQPTAMTTVSYNNPIADVLVDASSILEALVQRIRTYVRRDVPPDDAATAFLQFATREIGARVLAATSPDDLEDRLDEIVFGRSIYQVNALAIQMAPRGMVLGPRPTAALAGALRTVLDRGAVEDLQRGEAVLDLWFAAQTRVLHSIQASETGSAVPQAGPWLLTDRAVPTEISTIIAGVMRATACVLALTLALERGQPVQPEIGSALVQHLVQGATGHLRLLAWLPQAAVPAGAVASPLELPRVITQHAKAERRVADMLRAMA